MHVKVVGLAGIEPDVTPDLALAAIGSITVLGALQASAEVKAALADRIHYAKSPNQDRHHEHAIRCGHAPGVQRDARPKSRRGH